MFKGILTVLVVVMMVFAAGLAYASEAVPYDINGMTDGGDVGGYDVYVNPGNLGDVLIYGYYNVRGYDNFFTIVNTSDVSGVVARVRFREAKDSEEILDFNVCLSKDDMFVGIVVDDGSNGRIYQLESDTTLTHPSIPDTGVAFKTPTGVTAENTKEGYLEVIGLTSYDPEPTDCPDITTTLGPANDVPNVLMGSYFMAEDATGLTFAYRAMALADFHFIGIPTPTGLGFDTVNLGNGFDGFQGVDWALTKETINSEYMLEIPSDVVLGSVTGEAAYVITFPTKKLNIAASSGKFGDASCNSDTGVSIGIGVFDENETPLTSPADFSPIITSIEDLCYEVNVRELQNATITSDILDSAVENILPAWSSSVSFGFGWVRTDLYNSVGTHSTGNFGSTAISYGLPAWVWWLQTVDGELSHANEMGYTTDVVLP